MRIFALLAAVLWGSGAIASAQTNGPLIYTGVTGAIRASGMQDPQYILSFIPIQRLMLEAARHPLTREEINSAVRGTPVDVDTLVKLELLRKQGDEYLLNYLLLTKQDQEEIYRLCSKYGQSLAEAFRRHQKHFDRIFSGYPNPELRPELMFDLIAGAALNWQGLQITTQLGYRVQPPHHADGSVYLVHSNESGAQLDLEGLYLDSETAPGSTMTFSTFGDGPSAPRLRGLPDVFDGIESAVGDWKDSPEIFAALRSEYISLLLLAIDDAGQVMRAVADGTNTDDTLAKSLPLPADRREKIIRLLVAIGYLREANKRYSIAVPLVSPKDRPLVDACLKLSSELITDWLQHNYPLMKTELSDLSPMRNGVPFSLAFSEVWHYAFGFATKSLAESGFYANPRSPGAKFKGYVPLVWSNSLLKGPGD